MKTLACYLILFVIATGNLRAQFLQFQVEIQTEATSEKLKDLAIPLLKSGSGDYVISLESKNTGIIQIKGFAKQMVRVAVEPVIVLKNINASVKASFEFFLNAAYNNHNENNIAGSTEINSSTFFCFFEPLAENVNYNQFWRSIYIYLYGSMDLRHVSHGIYRGEASVHISYL